jgi:2-isopropylmalate synthase
VSPSEIQLPQRIMVFDTSLRDGEQAPGFSLGVRDKLMMAHALKDLGVDIIEAGFAAASPGDEAAIHTIAREVKGPILCSLSRALESDLDAAARALEPAGRSRVHIFLATSPIHRAAKLKKTRDQVLETGIRAVAYAAKLFDEVEFSPEDAIRTEPDFLHEICKAVADNGAKIINVPDTVGYSTPPEIFRIFSDLKAAMAGYDVIFSAHCHNDLGLGVANSLSALQAGARQVECTINGIGERAGNAALEEVIMALKTRFDLYNLTTGIDTTKLAHCSRLLARATGSVVMRNKAIVGKNAFAHESGIHQHGMLSDARTYEIMRPEDVGVEKSNLVLGKHSGRHAIAKQAASMGYDLDDLAMGEVFAAFKRRADEIGEIDEPELKSILSRSNNAEDGAQLLALSHTTTSGQSCVSISLGFGSTVPTTYESTKSSSLSAALSCLSDAYGLEAFGLEAEVIDCEILQAGFDFDGGAFAEININIKGEVNRGRGRGPDGVWAGTRALIDAFEKSTFARTKSDGAMQSPNPVKAHDLSLLATTHQTENQNEKTS